MEYIKTFEQFINESKLTGNETSYNSKQFLQYFQNEYPYIGPNISSKELDKWLKQDTIKRVNLAKAADYFQDYLLANNLADVQESEVNESVLNLTQYVKKAGDKAQSGGGNGVNITDYGTGELASLLEAYYASGRGNENIYTDKTVKLFKQLIDSMVDDEIKNNQVDESKVNEGHDGEIGPLDNVKNRAEAEKLIRSWIKTAKEEDGDLKKFIDVKWLGRTTEDKMDRESMRYEDQYVILGEVDGEIWLARSS